VAETKKAYKADLDRQAADDRRRREAVRRVGWWMLIEPPCVNSGAFLGVRCLLEVSDAFLRCQVPFEVSDTFLRCQVAFWRCQDLPVVAK